MRISVVGTGYLGATHAACLAALGHDVIGVDADEVKVRSLSAGRAPFHEPGLDDLLRQGLDSGRLRFSTDISGAAAAQAHFICVGTPQSATSGRADLTALWSAVHSLAGVLGADNLVVGKSTVPVGTAAQIARWFERHVDQGVRVAWNPEFLREGFAVADTLMPDRLVFGVEDDTAAALLHEVYAPIVSRGVPAVRTERATAELAKLSANVMLASRLSTVNVLAEVCEQAGADIHQLVTVLGLDHRIGREFLEPGLGFGGSCLPKDLRAFVERARELGVDSSLRLLVECDAVNLHQRARTVARVEELVSEHGRPCVAILGAAFKPGSDDVRDSPALDVASRLHADGLDVRVYDPLAVSRARVAHPELSYADSVEDACRGAHLVLVLTAWEEFAGIDPMALGVVVSSRIVLDARLALDADKWSEAGWEFHALGRAGG
jgi:UDPglucose 6-dehydrogenase